MGLKITRGLCVFACVAMMGAPTYVKAEETVNVDGVETEVVSDIAESAQDIASEDFSDTESEVDSTEENQMDTFATSTEAESNYQNYDLSANSNKPGTYKTKIEFASGKDTYAFTTKKVQPKLKVTVIYYATEEEIAAGAPETSETVLDPSLYKLTYTDNKKIGTAKVTIEGAQNGYSDLKLCEVEGDTCVGKKTLKFTIKKANVKNLKIKLSSEKVTYTGKEKKVSVSVSNNGTKLIKGLNYTVAYKHNVKLGTAKVVITGKGKNYGGTVEVPFEIKVGKIKKGVAAGKSYNKIKVKWTALKTATKYQIYRSTTETGNYEKIGTVKAGATEFYDENPTYRVTYYYKVRACIKQDGKNYYGTCCKADTAISKLIDTPTITSATYNTATTCKVYWNLVNGADGYQLYKCKTKSGTYSKVGTYKSTTVSKKVSDLTSGTYYYFKVRAYRLSGTTKIYTSFSAPVQEVKKTSYDNVGDSRLAELFPNGVPTTQKQMEQYLTDITFPVMDKSGNKGKMSITIHKKLASKFTSVFTDLYKMKFPISDAGGYCWRSMATSSNRSHHSYGCTVDINVGSNPMITSSGVNVTSGYYRPGKDPYSVTEEVVDTFMKYGFYWGGNWNSSKDYMHFSYTNH